ncbi:MAG: tRNA (N6-isopentenyl adenosine(37)-C2)-methylthiotransferase MiaB [Acetivibrionales bacterium]
MANRGSTLVTEDEITRQEAFMHSVRELNPGADKKYLISTFGCQMNENDSEKLAGMLESMGYIRTDEMDECDLILFNTCCVRENAELKVYGHLGALKPLKSRRPGLVIAVCGCMMQQKEVVEHILEKYRHVDLIFGTHNLHKFPELLYRAVTGDAAVADISSCDGYIAEGLPVRREHSVKAWLTIMYGCNNFCSYCIVPHVRGRERSRMVSDILDEARFLARQGYKEITLLGQNVNSYGLDRKDGTSFAALLHRLEEIDGIERVRFMTSHPKDLSDELIYAMRDCHKVCEHLHLPVQAGSSRILAEMNRRYSREHYFELVQKVREHIPGISITTDIIVGFPGETDEDFEDTLDLVENIRFDYAYTFLYSRRTGTPAARKTDQVSEEVKKKRFEELLNIQNRISNEINSKLAGTVTEVLTEGHSKNNIDMMTGRTRTNKIVNFKGSADLTGRLVRVKIDKTGTWSLDGTLV